jgi:AraC family transcriptional regulator
LKRKPNPVVFDEYQSRINRVCDHIDKRLGARFTLSELARVACFSKYHFHRVFTAVSGETLFDYIQRRRVEKAAYLLWVNPRTPITDIALACGFADSSALARAFRRRFRTTASHWRARILRNLGQSNSNRRQDRRAGSADNPPVEAWRCRPAPAFRGVRVTVTPQPEMTVAYVRRVGPFQGDAALFARMFKQLTAWAGPRDLLRPGETRALIMTHDTPGITGERRLRVSACLTVPAGTATGGPVGRMLIPGGKYARARFHLRTSEYGRAWTWMFGTWLPSSGYQADDRPCFEMYALPARKRRGRTTVDICVAVKPL